MLSGYAVLKEARDLRPGTRSKQLGRYSALRKELGQVQEVVSPRTCKGPEAVVEQANQPWALGTV